jgi:dTMP kinase
MTNDSNEQTQSPGDDASEQHYDDLAAEAPQISGSLEAQRYHSTILDVPEEELQGELIVLEGPDGSGRSTQIRLLTEWLELNGFAVQTMGLRRSYLLAQDIDQVLAQNVVRRLTLALLYATDFYDQLENRILPAMRSGLVVLADRYIFTLLARAAARGLEHNYLENVYSFAIDPDLTFRLRVAPNTSFERIFRESQSINYWEAGGDLNLSENLYDSFVMYQEMIRDQFDEMGQRWDFDEVDGEQSVKEVNAQLRESIGAHLGIEDTDFEPSQELMHLWQI